MIISGDEKGLKVVTPAKSQVFDTEIMFKI